MKIQPRENYELIGTGIRLDKTKIYNAVHATNQPDFEELGLVFCGEVLLSKNEYDIIHPNITDANWDKVETYIKGGK